MVILNELASHQSNEVEESLARSLYPERVKEGDPHPPLGVLHWRLHLAASHAEGRTLSENPSLNLLHILRFLVESNLPTGISDSRLGLYP